MNTLVHRQSVKLEQGFRMFVLGNDQVEVAVVPELGARIVSLKNVQTGREWLWHPHTELKLFTNHATDDFSRSPLAGIDECFPTIAPCVWRGRRLSDHGELWHTAWHVDDAAWQDGVLTTHVRLAISPFQFQRSVSIAENEIRLEYHLTSLSDLDECFLWALHPLLRLQPGDRLQLPESSRRLLQGAAWIDAINVSTPDGRCEKAFAFPVTDGMAAVCNATTGERLEFVWDAEDNPALGLWLTRGGWHSHHHFAIEPSNADHDSLAVAAQRNRCGIIAPGATLAWQMTLRLNSE